MKYFIRKSNDLYLVYEETAFRIACVKSFKTEKGAQNWVRKHS